MLFPFKKIIMQLEWFFLCCCHIILFFVRNLDIYEKSHKIRISFCFYFLTPFFLNIKAQNNFLTLRKRVLKMTLWIANRTRRVYWPFTMFIHHSGLRYSNQDTEISMVYPNGNLCLAGTKSVWTSLFGCQSLEAFCRYRRRDTPSWASITLSRQSCPDAIQLADGKGNTGLRECWSWGKIFNGQA